MYKNKLQEKCQKTGGPLPVYSVKSKETPGNNPVFQATVTATIYKNTYSCTGDWATSKKETEMSAAQKMLILIKDKDINNLMKCVALNDTNVILDGDKPAVSVQPIEPIGLSTSRPTLFIDIENCHLSFEKIYQYYEKYDIVAVASSNFTKQLPKIVTLERIDSYQPESADIHLIICICKYHYEKNVTTAIILSNDNIFDNARNSLRTLLSNIKVKWIKQLPKINNTTLFY